MPGSDPGVLAWWAAVSVDSSPTGLVEIYARIGRALAGYDRTMEAMSAVVATATDVVPGVEWASVTRGRAGRFRTVASTDPRAEAVDSIQYELDTGPCVDAILEDTTFRTGDLRADTRWPDFGRPHEEAGARSMLSFRLFVEDADAISGLNLYSTAADAFGEPAQLPGTVLATHGALALAAASAREHAHQLERALLTNRDIGVAMGILMANHKITREQAFDLLRVSSQNSNRKLVDIASDVADTGVLDLPTIAPPRDRP